MKILWTDGSAVPNPGKGGFAVIDQATGEPVALGRGEMTTNIRMEGMALAAAMRLAGDEPCEIHTDSEIWLKTLTKWAAEWEKNDWKKAHKKPIQNLTMVKMLFELYKGREIKLIWEKGHAGVELNEKADRWANRARKGETFGAIELEIDEGEPEEEEDPRQLKLEF